MNVTVVSLREQNSLERNETNIQFHPRPRPRPLSAGLGINECVSLCGDPPRHLAHLADVSFVNRAEVRLTVSPLDFDLYLHILCLRP